MQLREANDSYLGRNITAKNVSFKSRAAGFFLATTAKIFYVAVPRDAGKRTAPTQSFQSIVKAATSSPATVVLRENGLKTLLYRPSR